MEHWKIGQTNDKLKIVVISAIILFAVLGCLNPKKTIVGNWYFFNNNGLYNELYVDSTNYIIKNIPDGIIYYKYGFHNDTLYTFFTKDEIHMFNIPRFISRNKYQIVFENEDTLMFYRLKEENISIHGADKASIYSEFIKRLYKYSPQDY